MTGTRLSLLTPSGHLTLGNYLGALRPMTEQQDQTRCFFGISGLHAMTTAHHPATLRTLTIEMKTLMLACGLDLAHATLFQQSHVSSHTELAYLLECTTYVGELNRMIQFKEKGRDRPRTRASLYTYPVLMAADILLYRPTQVPVGEDQRQHVELTRDIAQRFNTTYGTAFTVPEVTVQETGARLMDLADPTCKMSKSTQEGAGVVRLLDAPDVVRRKLARALTDSETGPDAVRHDPATKPGVSNLLEIIAACEGTDPQRVADDLTSYAELKRRAAEAVLGVLAPIQDRYADLVSRPGAVEEVYAEGAERCREVTAPVLRAAKEAMGLN